MQKCSEGTAKSDWFTETTNQIVKEVGLSYYWRWEHLVICPIKVVTLLGVELPSGSNPRITN